MRDRYTRSGRREERGEGLREEKSDVNERMEGGREEGRIDEYKETDEYWKGRGNEEDIQTEGILKSENNLMDARNGNLKGGLRC